MHGTIYGQFSFERLRPSWRTMARPEQDRCLNGIQYLLTRYPLVRVDHYIARESHPDCDFVLRWESDNPEALRDLVVEMRASEFFRHVETARTMSGKTRAPQYADAGQMRELARSKPAPALKRWAFLFEVSRTSDWWHLPEIERRSMVQEHIANGLDYSEFLHRRCYYCEGLDTQQDFVYYLEANAPDVVHEAYNKLKLLRDGHYWARHSQVFLGVPVTLEEWQNHIQMAHPADVYRPMPPHPEIHP